MVRLAIAGHPQFALSRIDIDREGPTYTVDTMRLLRAQLGAKVELFFIMGMDSLANILIWRTPEKLIQVCQLAVFSRPGFDAPMDALEKHLPGLRQRVVFLPAPMLDIAANDLQRRIRAGLPIAHLVPATVANYITANGLYRDEK
jgi:nicotinate-nucleotide adenylyltransferase